MDERTLQIQACMYQYSRAIYRSIKDLIDPYVDPETQLEYRREVLEACEQTMERLAKDPLYFAKPDRALFQDIRRYFPITARRRSPGRCRRASRAAVAFIESRSRPARSTAASPAAGRRRARASRASARRCPSATTARRTSTSSARRSRRSRGLRLATAHAPRAISSLRVSHDTDKLIRQLSLVAFLMAERRALTARDVKGNVEGYSEMSDEAFARRFYSDRAELLALGVPLHSQRDEFTGEELYTLRSEQLLPAAARADRRRARGAADLPLPARGQVRLRRAAAARAPEPRARPARASREAPTDDRRARRGARPRLLGRDAGPARQARGARSRSSARSSSRTGRSRATRSAERTVNPYALFHDSGAWYVVGARPRPRRRSARSASRASAATSASRRAASATSALPADFDVDALPRPRRRGRSATPSARRGSRSRGDTAWWVERTFGDSGQLEDGVFVTDYSSLPLLASWVLRQDGRAVPLAPDELRREVARAPAARARAPRGRARRSPPRESAVEVAEDAAERPAGAGRARALRRAPGAARVPARRCGEETRGRDPGRGARRALPHPGRGARGAPLAAQPRQLRRRLLRGLRRARTATTVHVDKELFGDTFRAPPRLTPLEARAIRLALEFVGPMIAADAHSPLDRVRTKLEETFGEFELAQTPEPHVERAEEDLVAHAQPTASASGGSSRSST